jgi:hypothetical protein
MNWKGYGRKWWWPKLLYFPVIRLDRVRKPINFSVSVFDIQAEMRKARPIIKVWNVTALANRSFFPTVSTRPVYRTQGSISRHQRSWDTAIRKLAGAAPSYGLNDWFSIPGKYNVLHPSPTGTNDRNLKLASPPRFYARCIKLTVLRNFALKNIMSIKWMLRSFLGLFHRVPNSRRYMMP